MKNFYSTFPKMLILFVIGLGSIGVFAQDPLLVGAIGSSQSICTGTAPAPLTSNGPLNGTDPVYQWQSSTDNAVFSDIPGATLTTYMPGTLTATTYFRQLQDATGTTGGPLPTNVVTITVKPNLVVGSISPNQSVCSNVTPAMLVAVPPSTGSTPTYQWQLSMTGFGFFDLGGATNQNYQPNPLFTTTDSITYYFRQKQNDPGTCGGPLNTNIISLTVLPDLIPGTATGTQAICTGMTPAPLTCTAPENGLTPTYKWQVSSDNVTFSDIPGATDLSYQPGPLTSTAYYRMEQNAGSTCAGPKFSNVVTVTVNPVLLVGVISSSQIICPGIPGMLTATGPFNGTNPTYQWQSSLDNSTFANISGATMMNYQPGNVTATTHFRQIQNADGTCGGPSSTNTITITINPDLVPGTVSASQALCAGDVPALLTSVPPAMGTAPVYQWQSSLDNVTFANISGATLATYQPGAMTATTYYRQLQNASGTCGGPLATAPVVLTLNPLFVAGSIAASQTIAAGTAPALLTGIAPVTGTSPVYQWQTSIDNMVFTDIPGATSLDYQPGILNVTTYYRQQQDASGTCGGPLATNTVTITVNPQLIVGTVGSDQTICTGSLPAMLTSTPPQNGTNPVYQWQSSLDNSTFANISGATLTTYQPGNLTATTYYRQVQNAQGTSGGPLPTAAVTITVNPDLIAGTAGANQVICAGSTPAAIAATPPANGTMPVYQWQSSLDNNTFANIGGATALTYQPGSLSATTYFRQLQNASGTCGGPLATNPVTITVNPLLPVSVTISASATVVCAGAAVTFTALPVNGGAVPEFKWMVNSLPAGDNSASFTYVPVNNDVVTCILTSGETCTTGSPAVSNPVVMTVNPLLPVTVSVVASANPVCAGTVVNFTATPVNGGMNPSYQWMVNGSTAGSNSPVFSYAPLDGEVITCQLTSSEVCATGSPALSNAISMTVNPLLPVSVTIAASANNVCEGTSVTFTATPVNGGTSPVFEWMVNGIAAGNNNIVFNYIPVNGDVVTCKLTSSETCTSGSPAVSVPVTMIVNPLLPVSVSITASANPVCAGTNVTYLALPVNGGLNPAFQWSVNGTPTGPNSASYSFVPLNGDIVSCRLTSDEACTSGNPAFSNNISMVVDPTLVPGTAASNQSLCAGTTPQQVSATPPANGTLPVYQWQSSLDNNTFNNISGATQLVYQPGVLSTTTYYRQMQNATGVCGGPLPTNVVTISVNPVLPVSVSISASANPVCPGSPVTFTAVPVNGGTVPVFEWMVNGVAAGTDNPLFTYVPGNGDVVTCRLTSNETCTSGSPALSNPVTINHIVPLAVSVSITASANPICSGTNVTFLALPVNGGTNPQFAWFVNGNPVGANNASYSYIPVAGDIVTCQLTSDETCTSGNPAMSNAITMIVDPALVPGIAGASQSICTGTVPAALTATPPVNGTSPVYQWQSSLDNSTFANISGATTLVYQPGSLTVTTYYRQFQNATGVCGGPLPTNVVTITVKPELVAGTVAASQVICAGMVPALLTATGPVNGTSPVYQWQSSTDNTLFNDIAGATDQNYQPTALGVTTYFRQVQDASNTCGGPKLTNVITITVQEMLIPGTAAASQSVCAGSVPAAITTTGPLNGTSPVYQWQSSLDNVTFSNILGATSTIYQPGPVNVTTYFRQLQNATGVCGGPLPTNVVTISIEPDLVAGTVATSQTICTGSAPAELVSTPPANGTNPSYQWQSSLDNLTFANINGATQATYQPGNLIQTTHYRQLQNALTGCNGPVTTNSVTITVNPLLVVGSIGASQTICSGDIPAMLTGVAPANGNVATYQWQSSTDNVTFSDIPGAIELDYQPTAVTVTTWYRLMQNATGTCGGPLPTNVVAITVDPPLMVGAIAADQSICSNQLPAMLTGTPPANGNAPTYQWQSSLDNVTFNNILGATSLNYQPGTLAATTHFRQMQNAQGTCGGPLATNIVTITVTDVIIPGTIAASQTICSGDVPALLTSVPPVNGTSPAYQWQSSLDNITFSNILGATVQTYQPGALTSTTHFRQLQNASGVCGGPLPTNTVTITVTPALAVGSISADQTICLGSVPAMLTGTPPTTGTAPVYQWESSLDNSTFANISGATALNYQPGALNVTTYYRLKQNASGTCGGPLPTNVVTITVGAFPAIIPGTIAASQSICAGQAPAMLTGTPPANGTLPTYQWQSSLNNLTFSNISGATALNYQPGTLAVTTYYRQLQDAQGTCGGPSPTNTVTITVNPQLAVGSISADQTLCSGDTPAMLTGVPPSNGTSPVYQWQSSLNNVTFSNILGATSLNYQPGAITATTYFRQLQNAAGTCGGPLPTNVVTITFKPALAVGSISANQSVCTGSVPAQLNGIAPLNGTAPTYQWQSSLNNVTFTNVSGATSLNYQPGALTSTTYYRQLQNASGTCGGPLPTNVVTITVNPLPVPTITGPASVCVNATGITYSTEPGMTGYTWTVSPGGTITAGSNTNTITVVWTSTGAQTVSVNYTNGNGCTATTATVKTVTVNPLPVPTITGPATACVNSAGNVYTTEAGMSNYSWTVSAGGTITAGSGTNAITVLWTTTGSQTVTVNYENGNGCAATVPTSKTVVVNPLPVPTITGNASACVNSTGNIYSTEAGMTGYTWTVSAGGTITAGAGTNAVTVTWTAVGPQNLTVNYTNGNGCTAAAPASYAVTVNPLPVPTITGPASVCVNSTGNVYTTEAGMTGYTWTVSAGGTITAGAGTNAITVTWSAVGAQTVAVNYTNGNGCTAAAPASYAVTVNPLPVPTITGPASACVNSTGNVYTTEAGMTGYTWTVSAGGTITAGAGTSAITVTWTAVGPQTVTVNYTNGNGCTAATPTTKTVTVNPLPVPTITGPASACVNSTGNVYTTEAGMTGYAWTVSAGGTITAGAGTNAITVTWTAVGAQTITVNYTNGNGCTAATPTTKSVTVNPLPVPTITGPASACVNSTGNVYTTEAGMTGYTWTVSAGGTITAGAGTSAITVTWTAVGAQTVTVNYTNANGCTAAVPTSKPVTVNPLPVPTITGPATACVNTTGNVYTTETGMTGYTWTVSAGGTITAGTGTNAITVTWTTTGAKTVTVNYTNANGCTAATPTIYNVTVNAVPVPTITGPAASCQGNSATYTTQAGMTNYVWTVSAGGTITGGGTSTSNTVTVTWNSTGAQTVSVSYTNVCPAAAPAVYNVNVTAAPVPTIGSTNNPCVGSTDNIYYTESGMTNYIWTVSAGGTIVSGQGTSTLNVTWNQQGIQTVTVNYTNASGCSAAVPTVYTVFVNNPPNAAGAITGTATVCAGTNGVTYSTTPIVGATSYSWVVPSGATIVAGLGTTAITVNFGATAVSGNITVAGTNQCGNGPMTTFPVTVNPLPAAAGTITGPATVCLGNQNVTYSVAAIASATSYTWTVPAGATIVSGATTNTIVVNFTATGSGVITVKGNNACGSGAVSPDFNVTVNATPATPVITALGNVLTCVSPAGNYQWYYEGTAISGATNQSYTVVNNTGYYWCVVTVNGCASPISNKEWVVVTGLVEQSGASFNVFPVPNNGTFNVSISTPAEETFTIRVYSQLGVMLYEMTDATTTGGKFSSQITLPNVADGLYSVVFLNDQHKVIRKMVVSRLIRN